MSKDTCYLTDEETAKRVEIVEEKNKAYIEGFGYMAPSKTKTIIVDSDGDINKMVGTMEYNLYNRRLSMHFMLNLFSIGFVSIKLLLYVFWKIDAFYSQKRLTCAELYGIVCVAKKVIRNKGSEIMRKKLLTNGNVHKRTDGRWSGVIWYMDEQGERKRKCFSGTTKQEANKKITAYIA